MHAPPVLSSQTVCEGDMLSFPGEKEGDTCGGGVAIAMRVA
jgi:hypothetical protein